MNKFTFSVPQDVYVGAGSLKKIPEIAAKIVGNGSADKASIKILPEGKPHKAFIITGPHLAKMNFMNDMIDGLKRVGISADVFSDTQANPSVDIVEKAAYAYKKSEAEMIIAFGGGSPMDTAKAAAVVAKYGGNITEYEGGGKVPGPVDPIIAVPTTAGTGSEVTAFSVITDHSRNYKLTVFSYDLIPAYAVLDPEVLASTPKSVAAACGIDAFIHAEESYISKDASPFTEMMSKKAMEYIGSSIRTFTADSTNINAAENMMIGSLFAGIAFSWARLGDIHAMSHPVSAFFNVPHGVANGIIFPAVAEFNALSDKGKYLEIAECISRKKINKFEFVPEMLPDMIRELNHDIGIPERLSDVGVKSEYFSQMADDAMKSGNIAVNPRTTSKSDVIKMYERLF